MFEPLVDFLGIGARVFFAGQEQGRTHHRFIQFTQQHRGHRMIRNPQTNRAAPFVLQAPRRLARSLEQKRIWPGRMRPQQSILPIVDHGVFADIRKITAHQREVMIAVRLANLSDALECRLVADVTAERIARIRRINDHRTATQRFHRLAYIAALRGNRMQLQIDAHGVGYDTRMNQLLEWSPLIVFFVTFEVRDIYWATGALMVACVLQLALHRLRAGSFKTMHVVTTCVVLVLGAATLLLHDQRFIQWKLTVLLALTSAVFLGSMVVGKQPLVRRLLEAAFPEPLTVSARAWLTLNFLWAAWFAAFAVLNLYVAKNFAVDLWVKFKVFGFPAATMLFMLPQVFWLAGKASPEQNKPSAGAQPSTRAQRLRERLESRFAPAQLTVEDESHLHEGHAGAAGGQSHFRIRIVAEAFRDIPSVARHRLIYAAVDDLMKSDIHALAIEALAPDKS
jgi:intracellular septation protein